MTDVRGRPLVLVVEDDDDLASQLADALRQEGCAVERQHNGREALARLAVPPWPNLVLLDLLLPEVDGWRLYAELRLNANLPPIPIIVLTAATNVPTAGLTGIVDLLRKPAPGAPDESFFRRLREHVRRVVEQRHPTTVNYAVEIPPELARAIKALPDALQQAVHEQLGNVAKLPIASAWTPGDAHPVINIKVEALRVLVELDQQSRFATVVALMVPDRGWIGLSR